MELREKVLKKYRKLIVNEIVPIGSNLPSQRELAEKEGLTKSVANSIYLELEHDGLVEINSRRNTVVRDWKNMPNTNTITSIIEVAIEEPTDCVIRDFEEFRVLNEGKAAALSAQHRTEEDLMKLKSALDRIRKADNVDEFASAHLDFHLAIFSSSHNIVLSAIAARMSAIYYHWGSLNYSESLYPLSDLLEKVYEHIENRDSVHAEASMNIYSYESSISLNLGSK